MIVRSRGALATARNDNGGMPVDDGCYGERMVDNDQRVQNLKRERPCRARPRHASYGSGCGDQELESSGTSDSPFAWMQRL